MPSKRHIHQYQRRMLGKFTIYRCVRPGCTHYLREELAENQESLCNRCGEKFVMTKSLMLARPHCFNCTKGVEDIGSKLDVLLGIEKGD